MRFMKWIVSWCVVMFFSALSWGSQADDGSFDGMVAIPLGVRSDHTHVLRSGDLQGDAVPQGNGLNPGPATVGITDADIADMLRRQMNLDPSMPILLNQADALRYRQAYSYTMTYRMFVEEIGTLGTWLRVDEWASMSLHLGGALFGAGGVIVSAFADNQYLIDTFGTDISGKLGLASTGIFAAITAINTIGAYMSSAAKSRRGELAARGVSTVDQQQGGPLLPVFQPGVGGNNPQIIRQ